MPKNRFYLLQFYFLLLALIVSCNDSDTVLVESEAEPVPETLPMSILDLNDLSSFDKASESWSIVGGVLSDFNEYSDLTTNPGDGILVYQPSGTNSDNPSNSNTAIATIMEHGDILLELDFLLPKGSSSALQFMSRYGIEMVDNNSSLTTKGLLCGSIQRIKSDNLNETVIHPLLNTARTSGLWQTFKVLFRAPKFNSEGVKQSNAKFEYVYHNDHLIHENIELESPTIDANVTSEISKAPFQILSHKGALAIKNIKYKTYEADTLRFSTLNYTLYDGKFNEMPDYSTMTPIKSGTANSFENMTVISGKNEGFVIVYEGEFTVPTDGDYLIETIIDDGGTLTIDDSIAVRATVKPGMRLHRNIIYLEAGKHKFVTDCYAFDRWATRLVFNIEGPNMEKRAYLSNDFIAARDKKREKKSYDIDINESVEMIRGFVDHKGKKLTHTVSIGHPSGVHYSYDTRHNALLNAWKGDFADVNEMWVGRGVEQKLKPLNSVLSLDSGLPFLGQDLVHNPEGFDLADDGHPVFHFKYGQIDVADDISPNADGMLIRTLQFDNEGSKASFRIAEGEDITWLNDDWASVSNLYHLSVAKGKEDISIKQTGDIDQLMYNIPSGTSTLSYEISW